jgi:NOL1/NOP2/sun family putative RNA methylase
LNELRRDFPAGFLERYSQFIPDFDDFLRAMCAPLRRTFRVNTLKTSRARALELLADLNPRPVPWCDLGFWVEDGERLGLRLEHFLGLIYVQEAASMVPPLLLSPLPGERVVDLAAAPGSKTTQMAAMMENTGLIVANDQSPGRVRALISNVDRAGCLNVVVCRRDGGALAQALRGSCDRVLLDAPCSSEGTIRKSQEALDRWSVRAIERFSGLQRRLALAAYDALRPGGVMVYSTCTLAPEENEAVVTELLRRRPGAELLTAALPGLRTRPGLGRFGPLKFPESVTACLRILPQDNDTEAFFAAVIRRPGDEAR